MHARAVVASFSDLDALGRNTTRPRRPSMRWVPVHLIEEYAWNHGHADLLRAAIDGVVGTSGLANTPRAARWSALRDQRIAATGTTSKCGEALWAALDARSKRQVECCVAHDYPSTSFPEVLLKTHLYGSMLLLTLPLCLG